MSAQFFYDGFAGIELDWGGFMLVLPLRFIVWAVILTTTVKVFRKYGSPFRKR